MIRSSLGSVIVRCSGCIEVARASDGITMTIGSGATLPSTRPAALAEFGCSVLAAEPEAALTAVDAAASLAWAEAAVPVTATPPNADATFRN